MLAEDFQFANIGSTNIPGLTADIVWADAHSGFGRSTHLIYDGNGNLDLAHGSVPLAPYGGASALGGGWSFSMAFGGSAWSISYSHPTLAPGGKTPTGTWEHFIIPISLGEGVFLYGEAGDDLIVGNEGADYLDGGSENDLLAGGDGRDILLGGDGGSGNDIVWGHGGNDVIDSGDDRSISAPPKKYIPYQSMCCGAPTTKVVSTAGAPSCTLPKVRRKAGMTRRRRAKGRHRVMTDGSIGTLRGSVRAAAWFHREST